MKTCQEGIVRDAIVPAVTYCHLTLKNNYDDSQFSLGKYIGGFWYQNTKAQFPFLNQSYNGQYTSPPLNTNVSND